MALVETPKVDIGWKAVDFSLKATDNKYYNLSSVKGTKGLLIMFICNHCPYVKAVLDKIIRDVIELKQHGIGAIAIMSNDINSYPEDSFENMKKLAIAKTFPMPYVIDETQEIAKKYDAVCTPDFFGFNSKLELQYRGRIDDARLEQKSNSNRDLFNAMVEIAKTDHTKVKQFPSMGCSIKWKD
ncbi:Peroxiredoxin (PRX)-like protein [Rickettsiales bacterium Ac37b]|nr:Peroxiredoxin (PRX)-like protein [Rickettsiales bacterium Ac37b]